MKLLIAGSRKFEGWYLFEIKMSEFIDLHGKPSEIVCGMCKTGADEMAAVWAGGNKTPVKEFPAEWKKYGKAAGPVRNKAMAVYCDRALIFWDAKSKGTANMIEELKKAKKSYTVVYFNSMSLIGEIGKTFLKP